jgi:transposase
MQYVGLDVHKAFTYAAVVDREGYTVFERKFKNSPAEFDTLLKEVDKDSKLVLESCSVWQHIYDYMSDAGFDVVVAHPLKVRPIAEARVKTDKIDATVLANLLRTNMLPTSWVAPYWVRMERQLARHRASLVSMRSMLKNKIHAILLRHGIEYEYSDLFGKAGIEYLQSLDLPVQDRFELDQYISMLQKFNELIKDSQERIEEAAEANPSARLLMSMPGIDYYSALMICAEIGDVMRFESSEKLVSFAGLNPSVYQSGFKSRTGSITKQGDKHLRWIMIECANVAVRHDSKIAKFYNRLKKHKGYKVAIVATARKMLTYVYAMLKHGVRYQALQIHKVS